MGTALSRSGPRRGGPRAPTRGTADAPPRPARRSNRVGPRLDADDLRAFGTKLRAWYRRHARDLPWRRTRDPYAILVSE
ncbi:MAG: A/G-specific adenine glycosylase, partial [Gemmatimonadota bacterium]